MSTERINLKSIVRMKGGNLSISYTRTFTKTTSDGEVDEPHVINEVFPQKAHPDLERLFIEMKLHLAAITGQLGIKEGSKSPDVEHWKAKAEILENFQVSKIHMGGEGDDSEYIILVGAKRIGKKVFNFNTPKTLTQSPNEEYFWQAELVNLLAKIRTESELYIKGEKYDQRGEQMAFEFGAEEPGDQTVEEVLNENDAR